jgi:hypothetical protein
MPTTFESRQRPDPTPGAGEAVVRLRAAALNRRDVWIRKGQYAGIKVPIILGSDGAGEVADVGPDVDTSWKGREVVIDPSLNWGSDERAQDNAFNISACRSTAPTPRWCVSGAQSPPKARALVVEEAAALPLASVTAYRALVTRGRVQPGKTVLITGIGGGVATTRARHRQAAWREGLRHVRPRIQARGRQAARGHGWRQSPQGRLGEVARHRDGLPARRRHRQRGRDTFNKALDALKPGDGSSPTDRRSAPRRASRSAASSGSS